MNMNFCRRITVFLLCAALLIPLAGCAGAEPKEYYFFAMDTVVTLRLTPRSGADGARTDEIAARCEKILIEAERELSAKNDASPVSRFNAGADGALILSPLLSETAAVSLDVSRNTAGAFDCTLGALVELWNVKGGGPVPEEEKIREALSHTGEACFSFSADRIEKTDPDARLDFGGVGKGAAAGLLIDYLNSPDVLDTISGAVLSLGGNVALAGKKPDGSPYTVGVRDPDDAGALIGTLSLESGFVAVSGDYERYFEENGVLFHHILDRRTGYPAKTGLRSAAVICSDAALADALSTALFVLGEEGALALYESGIYDFEAVLAADDGRVIATPGLNGVFRPTDPRPTPNQPNR